MTEGGFSAVQFTETQLKPILFDLARALLVQQPPNPWTFIAQYAQQRSVLPIHPSVLPTHPSTHPACGAPAHVRGSSGSLTSPSVSRSGSASALMPRVLGSAQRLNTARSGDTEDWVRARVLPTHLTQQRARLCPACYTLRRECHLLKLKFLSLSYEVFQLARLPLWMLDGAIARARKHAIAASRDVIAVAAANLAEFAPDGPVAIPRGADSTSTSSSEDSAASSVIDALPDILKTQDFSWRAKHRISVSAEAISFSRAVNAPLPVYHKTANEVTRIEACLSKCFMFRCIVQADRTKLINCLKPVPVPAGTTVIRQGDSGDGMYFIDDGTLSVDRMSRGSTRHIRVVGPGDSFGEVALLYCADRSASVTAVSDCRLWFLHRDAFNILVRRVAFEKRERFERFLKSVPILQTLGLYSRGQLADACDEEDFVEHSLVYETGDVKADAFYIVVEGTALVETATESRVLGPADHFGEQSLIDDTPRQETVSAYEGPLKVISINRRVWKKIVGEPVRRALEKSL
eukprot:Gregarina_sp_Pseudo_9__504@NODE_1322_length_1690_cov_3_799515_g1241_i0_p1_GENE_NODE_1322_length_1690_cov_3_799515_g1241_i0NODE_1322_length_1690_cov_3_799515_g1241_i0_p1_ORF_typecomplete_len535_score136_18cNMP_binding/PF00027_29/6_3e24cNMP_binding/PF00027_29/8_4e10RIIa/PF02197_17/0_0003Cupin_2/PF07883_11/4e02Cupin_2/PF07883_11/2_8_NODE_1322_length_1690_cov_3_799515_g1241_i0861642